MVELADDEVDAVAEEPVMQQAVAPAPAPVVSSGVAASSAPAWGKGPSFAEKLKRAEAEKAKAEAQLKVCNILCISLWICMLNFFDLFLI